jgi:hypothetical protein
MRSVVPVAQWIEQDSSKVLMGVRFPPGAHKKKAALGGGPPIGGDWCYVIRRFDAELNLLYAAT